MIDILKLWTDLILTDEHARLEVKRGREIGILSQHSHGSATYYTINESFDDSAEGEIRAQTKEISAQTEGRDVLLQKLPDSLRSEILGVGHRMSPEKRETMLIRVCSVQAFSAMEIGIIFGNTRVWAKRSLKELVSAKKVLMVFPDKPNSKNQAYYTPKNNEQTNIDLWR